MFKLSVSERLEVKEMKTQDHINEKKVDNKNLNQQQAKGFFMSLFSNVTCIMGCMINRREKYLSGATVYRETTKNQFLSLLYFINHHYPGTPQTGKLLWEACDYLHNYFSEFPKVTEDDSLKALQQMDQLCAAVGVAYGHKFSLKVGEMLI